MGVQTNVLIAGPEEAAAIAASATPTAEWEGFTFNGFHHIQVCTLLSLLRASCPDTEFERYLTLVKPVAGVEEGPVIFGIPSEQVAELAVVAGLDKSEFEAIAASWATTDEFVSWSESEVRELLREVCDLAESASLQGKWVMLWQSV